VTCKYENMYNLAWIFHKWVGASSFGRGIV
jgi:hypothetical protein